MSGHTPGPLVVLNRGPHAQNLEIHEAAKRVKTIPLAYVMKLNDGEANATLYAAAPDLITACKAALNHIDAGDAFTRASTRAVLVAALKKARGEP